MKPKAPTSIVIYFLRTMFLGFKQAAYETKIFSTRPGTLLHECRGFNRAIKSFNKDFGTGENLNTLGYFLFYLTIQIIGLFSPVLFLVAGILIAIILVIQLIITIFFGFVIGFFFLSKKIGTFFLKRESHHIILKES